MDMGGMDSSDSGSTSDLMMTPYLHITGGDNLFFKSWQPSSNGAIAGACIALVAIAILERLLAGVRGRLEGYWARRTLVLLTGNVVEDESCCAKSDSEVAVNHVPAAQRRRSSPPFIIAHDVPRGLLHILQTTLSYILMLAVMTFNAAYIISIILGLGIGEASFGRWGAGARAVGH